MSPNKNAIPPQTFSECRKWMVESACNAEIYALYTFFRQMDSNRGRKQIITTKLRRNLLKSRFNLFVDEIVEGNELSNEFTILVQALFLWKQHDEDRNLRRCQIPSRINHYLHLMFMNAPFLYSRNIGTGSLMKRPSNVSKSQTDFEFEPSIMSENEHWYGMQSVIKDRLQNENPEFFITDLWFIVVDYCIVFRHPSEIW